jgi:hypothetical protein
MNRTVQVCAVLAAMLGGCALTMRGVDPNRDRNREPECADDYTPVFLDAGVASIAGALLQVAGDEYITLDDTEVAAAIAVSVVFSVTALVGALNYKECRKAWADWHASEAIREDDVRSRAGSALPGASASVPRPSAGSAKPARPPASSSVTTPTSDSPAAQTSRRDTPAAAGEQSVSPPGPR